MPDDPWAVVSTAKSDSSDPWAVVSSTTDTKVPANVMAMMKSSHAPTTRQTSSDASSGSMAREAALGFASGMGLPETTHASDFSTLPGFKYMATHPIEAAKLVGGAIYDSHNQMLTRGEQERQSGNTVAGLIHTLGGAIPIIGPAAVGAGEEIGSAIANKDPNQGAHGAGSALGLLLSLGLGTKKGQQLTEKGIGTVSNAVNDKIATPLAGRIENSIIGSRVQDFAFGKNPGEAVAKKGIVAATRSSLLDKINAANAGGEARIDSVLQSHPNGNAPLDVTAAVNGPIDAAIQKAVNSPAMSGRQELINELENLRNNYTQNFQQQYPGNVSPSGAKNMQMTPYEANQFKRAVGEDTKWTPEHLRGQNWEAVTAVKRQIYGNLKNAVNGAVPEVAPMNEEVANLMAASRALEHRVRLFQKNKIGGLGDLVSAGTTYAATHDPVKAIAVGAAVRALNSAPVGTGTAALLASHPVTIPVNGVPPAVARAISASTRREGKP